VWAHSLNAAGVRHSLTDHLRGTAELAGGFAAAFGARDAGYFLGLAHDAGKASCSWQEGLAEAEKTGGKVGIDHKTLGVYLAANRGLEIAQFALHGHHGGLTCRDHIGRTMRQERADGGQRRRAEAEAVLRLMVPELFDSTPVPLPPGFDQLTAREFLVRFLFSCLVDADALDTGAHRSGATRPQVTPAADFGELTARFEHRRAEFLGGRERSPADRWRDRVYQSCVAAAGGEEGLYRLAAPTGSGKTLATAAFALRHAAMHGKARVIVAVPFITITEQNAGVYRRFLDPGEPGEQPVVLEHHSHVDFDSRSADDRWRRLAAENWDAPFVVTTTVQLFESLFGRRPSRMRKVHRLANSVIVLDEVQALPHALLVPLADALLLLARHFGATVVLSSATQPELWSLGPLRDVRPRDIVKDPVPLFRAMRHARFEWWLKPGPSLEDVARRAAREPGGALVVVNTVKDARAVFAALRACPASDAMVRHLSAAMCPAHRQDVLGEVRECLCAKRPVLLVSTQLVEAGVDVDFPVVYRAAAPAWTGADRPIVLPSWWWSRWRLILAAAMVTRSPAARMAAPGWARGSVPAQVCGLAKACSTGTPYRRQVRKATESAAALRAPWQPLVLVPGTRAFVLSMSTCPSWWASAQIAWLLARPGGTRMRRAAHSVVPSSGQPGSRSTAKPSLRASQHRASQRPGGASPGSEGYVARAARGCPLVWDRSQTYAMRSASRQLRPCSPAPGSGRLSLCGCATEKISMPFSSRLTCRPIARHASYPFTTVTAGIREEISRTFAQVSAGSRAAARRHRTKSSAVRTSRAASSRRMRSAASRRSPPSSCGRRWPGTAGPRRAISGRPVVARPALRHGVARGR
jgi:CRISPR-associated endonuclease/helicase Cas3